MANTVIQIKNSGVTGNVPSALQPGELAINYVDGKLFYGNAASQTVLFDVVTEPSGLDGEIQYNDGGSFGATDGLKYDSLKDALVVNNLEIDSLNVYPYVVTSFNAANAAGSYANSAYLHANSSYLIATEAGVHSVAAFDSSNTKVSKSGDTITGSLVVTQNTTTDKLIVGQILSTLAPTQSTPLPNALAILSANSNNYVQFAIENIDPQGTSDFVITSDVGSDTDFYVDFGILNSQYNNQYPDNSLGTAGHPLDGYLYVQGSTIGQEGGNLVVGTTSTSPHAKVKIIAGGNSASHIVAELSNTVIGLNREIVSPTTTRISTKSNSAYNQANIAYIHAAAAFDKANSGGGNSFGIISATDWPDIVATGTNSKLTFLAETGIVIGTDAANSIIAIGTNYIGATNVIVDYGTVSEIGVIKFDYGYLA